MLTDHGSVLRASRLDVLFINPSHCYALMHLHSNPSFVLKIVVFMESLLHLLSLGSSALDSAAIFASYFYFFFHLFSFHPHILG